MKTAPLLDNVQALIGEPQRTIAANHWVLVHKICHVADVGVRVIF